MTRLFLAAWLFLIAAFMAGCASTQGEHGLFRETRIREIHLLTMPMALNLDQIPGADGFAVKIYAIDKDRPKSVSITGGSLEILIYDGVLTLPSLATNTPVSTWRFTSSELSGFAQTTSVGVVYALTPTWGDRKPRRDKITVIACYAPQDQGAAEHRVCSLPTTVTVSLPASFE